MLKAAFVSLLILSTTVLLHALGSTWWIQRLRRVAKKDSSAPLRRILQVLVKTFVLLITLHVLEVSLWAVAFLALAGDQLGSIQQATYFAFTTFTTLGYGDVTLVGPTRLLTGIAALNGILLTGWSTALSFAVIQRAFHLADEQPASASSESSTAADSPKSLEK